MQPPTSIAQQATGTTATRIACEAATQTLQWVACGAPFYPGLQHKSLYNHLPFVTMQSNQHPSSAASWG